MNDLLHFVIKLVNFTFVIETFMVIIVATNQLQGMGRTWEKFSSLQAEKPQKFETASGKENFQTETEGRTS